MTWKELLEENRVAAHVASKQEVDDLRGAVDRNLRDAAIAQLSTDNRFGLAYEAALLLAKIAIACAGYRVKGQGAHQTTFAALPLAVGPELAAAAAYLDRCRRKRNEISYDCAGLVSETEAAEIFSQTQALQRAVERWIATAHPALRRKGIG
jgi:hypothetical protein